MLITKIGIDLGTCNSLVFIPKKGIVLNEPSVVSVGTCTNRILAVGKDAKEMLGRTPETIKIFRPLRDGVIADYRITEAMIGYFIRKVLGNFLRIFKPEIVVAAPVGATSTERRAIIEAGMNTGAKTVYVVKEPLLAAIGASIPVNSCQGNMIINIGGGTSEIAVISLGGIVSATSIRIAGDKIDEAITEYIKKRYNLAIGTQTAEEIKIKIGSSSTSRKIEIMEIKGRDLLLGLPKNIKINNNEISKVIADILFDIINAAKMVLSRTPPELSADIMNRGIVISGGGALLRKIDKLFSKKLGVPCFIAKEPLFCVAKGTGVVIDSLDMYKEILNEKR